MELKEFTIDTKEDVVNFLTYLMQDLDLAFHPDNDFYDYVDKDGKETFTPEEADHLSDTFLMCLEWCQINNECIYKLSIDVFKSVTNLTLLSIIGMVNKMEDGQDNKAN